MSMEMVVHLWLFFFGSAFPRKRERAREREGGRREEKKREVERRGEVVVSMYCFFFIIMLDVSLVFSWFKGYTGRFGSCCV